VAPVTDQGDGNQAEVLRFYVFESQDTLEIRGYGIFV
jgi:hypothetical protein